MTKQQKKPRISMKQIEKIIAGFRDQRWPLIPVVEKIQEKAGYIPPEAIPVIARQLGLFPAQVQGVVTFYSQLYTRPRGKNIIRVCRGTACHVREGARILGEVEERLGIKPGESTPDLEYCLETVACFGACALAPIVVINDEVHGRMTTKKVRKVLDTTGSSGKARD